MERLTYFDGASYTALSSKVECVQKLGKIEDSIEQNKLSVDNLRNKINRPVYVIDKVNSYFSGWYLVRAITNHSIELNEECYVNVEDIGSKVEFYNCEV
jgi:hypothetical protein